MKKEELKKWQYSIVTKTTANIAPFNIFIITNDNYFM